jgi:uncharacterized protein DUF6516
VFSFKEIILLLNKSKIISRVEVKTFDEIKGKSIYKVRCNLVLSKYKFEIRLVCIENQILYSYQLFSKTPIIRWNNSPHYPKIKTHPHHFHTTDGNVIESELSGNVVEDLDKVLSHVKTIILDHGY